MCLIVKMGCKIQKRIALPGLGHGEPVGVPAMVRKHLNNLIKYSTEVVYSLDQDVAPSADLYDL